MRTLASAETSLTLSIVGGLILAIIVPFFLREFWHWWVIGFLSLISLRPSVPLFYNELKRRSDSRADNVETPDDTDLREATDSVDKIYRDRSSYDKQRKRLFSDSNNMRLCSIYAGLSYSELPTLVRTALEDGKTVEFLIANPTMKFEKVVIPFQLANSDIHTSRRVSEDIERLRNLEESRIKFKWRGRLEVKLYDVQPMWALYSFDKEMYAVPYLYRVEGSDSPCLYIRRNENHRSVYAHFQRHLNKLWRQSDTIIPAPKDETQGT